MSDITTVSILDIGNDQLGEPEYADRSSPSLAELHADDSNPNREALFSIATDGSINRVTGLAWKPLSVDILNSTNQTLHFGSERGNIIDVVSGAFVSIPLVGDQFYSFQTAGPDNTGRSAYAIFYKLRRPMAGASSGGTAAANVTVVGPLDGAGGVKVGLDGALPAGANAIGSVSVSNFPAGFLAEGTSGGALAQNAQFNLIVDERGTPNWSTGQVVTSTVAGMLAIARSTRQRIVVRNLDAAISVWVGPTTVTSANGVILKAGESRTFYTQTLLQVIAASGTPTVEIDDYWT